MDLEIKGLRVLVTAGANGIGLAIARRVVERHGGTIRVKTERGSGSTFTIELPG